MKCEISTAIEQCKAPCEKTVRRVKGRILGFLKQVKHFLGNTTLIESDPAEEIVSSVAYMPFSESLFIDRDPSWGVYYRNGHLVDAAAYRRGADNILVGQSEAQDLNGIDFDYIDEELIYGGPVIMHYGHFITAALPRLWNISHGRTRRRRILCHSSNGPDSWFSNEYMRCMFEALGLQREDFVHFTRPGIIKRLWIPRPAMQEGTFVHRVYGELGARIGRVYGVHEQQQKDYTIYLSKTKLKEGIQKYANEYILESYLAARGVRIMHPQEISFPDQLYALAGARAIGGTVGSALHTTLFLNRPTRIVALHGSDRVSAIYPLIDKAKRHDTVYLFPSDANRHSPANGTFSQIWSMDMEAAATEYATWLLN